MIPYMEVVDNNLPASIRDRFPAGLPSTKFADDTCFLFQIPKSHEAFCQFKVVLEDLEEVTGLKVNPSKSKSIPILNNLSELQTSILGKFGEIKSKVTHLGIIISSD